MNKKNTLGMIESQSRVSLLQAEVLEEILDSRATRPDNTATLEAVVFRSNMIRALILDSQDASDSSDKFVADCAVVTGAIELAAAAIRLATEGDSRYNYEFPHS